MGGTAGDTGAAKASAAAAPPSGSSTDAAPTPCGSGGNRVFARETYPDGLPCSLWVMLRTEAAGGSTSGGGSGSAGRGSSSGSHSEPSTNQAAAGSAAAGSAVAAAAGMTGERRRVVPWSRPEELAELLRAELQLN